MTAPARPLAAVATEDGPSGRRLPLTEKLSFFAGNLGNILLSTTISSFLLLYLTDVLGLAAAAVGTLLLVVRIVDSLVDPFVGYTVDHLPVTRRGRFRTYLLIGGVLGGIGFVALFLGPALLPAPLAVAWAVYLFWGFAFPAMDIPLNSLLPAMTSDRTERGTLASVKGFTYLLGSMLVVAAALPAVGLFDSERTGWLVCATVLAVVSVALTATAALGVRERVRPTRADRYGVRDLLRIFTGGRSVAVLLTAKVATSAAGAATLAGLPFYFLYNVGDKGLVSVAALVMTVPMAGGSVVAPVLARRLGGKSVYLGALAVAACGNGVLLLVPYDRVPAIMACLAVAGLGTGAAVTLNYVLLAELTDHVEWRHGHRAEGALASLASFAAKAGGGLGGAATAYCLGLFGYVAHADQSERAMDGIRYAQAGVPLALTVLGGLVFLTYPITRRVSARITEDLTARRSASPAQQED
ncbi:MULTISPECIES: MFS transporter [unclassified Streptomyces]|uniref:MFS transporter n=1 Tax=unclassified Streptomyces TaxID=2593676 RepID=UPI0036EDECC6